MVLDILTPPQIGDMVVHSDTLTRMDLATQLVQFFQESKPEDVQMILVAFTKAAMMVFLVAFSLMPSRLLRNANAKCLMPSHLSQELLKSSL